MCLHRGPQARRSGKLNMWTVDGWRDGGGGVSKISSKNNTRLT